MVGVMDRHRKRLDSPNQKRSRINAMQLHTLHAPGKADQGVVRQHNASIVLHQLRLHAPLSRADLARRIGLNRSTVSSIVTQLLHQGFIHETARQTDKVGRPGLALELNPGGGCAVGVEMDAEGIHVILTDFVANVLWRRRVSLGLGESQESHLHCAEILVRQALDHAAGHGVRVLGIGLALPGLVDVEQGRLTFAPSMQWEAIDFRRRWSERFGLPVMVENNANAAALGEFYFGAARNTHNFIYLGAGATVGGGIVINGEIFRGRGGFAGEIGHMTLDPDGAPCRCGRRGCWETLVGPQAVVAHYQRRTQRANGHKPPHEADIDAAFQRIVAAADKGDLAALAVMQDLGHYLGIGIANLVNIFNPQLVVLGGLFSHAHELIIPVIKEAIKRHSLFPMRLSLSILPSQRADDDCIHGAVALILDELMRAPV